ncbi:phosphate signaling complex protein PhoU [Blastomonas sp.]|uniref:phosphate signaling complex protein PhoU n=1 Tax=Blastomonas sp. TaxID=1909299 RepID=UPI0035932290
MHPSHNEHTLKAFDGDLTSLRGLIAEIGGRAEKAVQDAMLALATHDLALAQQVIAGDAKIDALEDQIDRLVIQTIALRAPMADDLRELVAALKISGVVERMGDYAKNIAKRVALVDANHNIEAADLLPAMADATRQLVDDAFTAFARRDADLAVAVCAQDKTVDDFYNSIFHALIAHMIANPDHVGAGTHLLFIAKNLERIGDHATNVAEMVFFAVTGQSMNERERGDDALAPVRHAF